MRINRDQLVEVAHSHGFQEETLEKVVLLLTLLDRFQEDPFLKDRFVLKGGTALNLFLWQVPRLSVDIDLNYIGSVDKNVMQGERPRIEQLIQSICSQKGFVVKRMPSEHAGGKWRLRYRSVLGKDSGLEVDVNFMYRQPLLEAVIRDSYAIGPYQVKGIPVQDIHELSAGKLSALMSRTKARDLFDTVQLFNHSRFNLDLLRVGFVVYGAKSRKDWRTVSIQDIKVDPNELSNSLIPVLSKDARDNIGSMVSFGQSLMDQCQNGLKHILPFADNEKEFLDRLLDHGEIVPSLLTKDDVLTERISKMPMLHWKAMNVRKYK